jgi:hypothetical protein
LGGTWRVFVGGDLGESGRPPDRSLLLSRNGRRSLGEGRGERDGKSHGEPTGEPFGKSLAGPLGDGDIPALRSLVKRRGEPDCASLGEPISKPTDVTLGETPSGERT